MTANESETSALSSRDQAGGADEELWLTYLNYDQRIQQAVRRLGALSSQNVDVFRSLLLKDRDRSRVKDYEAESIRRLQGEAFVGDEELQRTLIVLNAENPRFGEELKRQVAASGKPAQLDQAVAAIRSGKPVPEKPKPPKVASAKPATPQVAPPVEVPPVGVPPVEVPKIASSSLAREQPRKTVVVPLRREKDMAAPAPQVALREDIQPPRRSLTPLVVVAGLVAVAGIAALVLPGLISGNKPAEIQTASAPVPATPQAAQAPAIAPVPAAPKPAAPAADIPLPPQADKSAQPGPTLRPGSTQPDAPANTADEAAQPDVSAKPVVGGKYKVVRGDMLSDIALQVYGDAHKFRLIQAANPGIRHSPNRILVDQVIFIPPDKP